MTHIKRVDNVIHKQIMVANKIKLYKNDSDISFAILESRNPVSK